MKKTIFILFSFLCISAKTHTFAFPDHCGFLTSDGDKFPASDKEFFEKLQELQCPELSYRIWGMFGKNIEERRFLVYDETRDAIHNCIVGVCRAAKHLETTTDPTKSAVIHYSKHECHFDNYDSVSPYTTKRFDKNRRNK